MKLGLFLSIPTQDCTVTDAIGTLLTDFELVA